MSSRRPSPDVRTAMVLAAGDGRRMRPLTKDRPKALVKVAGRPMIDRILDSLSAAGIEETVVNLHYKADMLRTHLVGRKKPIVDFSDERAARLDTGGGVARALPQLGAGPFVVVNGDVLWLDGVRNTVRSLIEAWDDAHMDALLLLHPTVMAVGYDGIGDYFLGAEGRPRRRREGEVAPFTFAGIQLLHSRVLEGLGDGAFSLNRAYDRAEAGERLAGLRHEGIWMHVGRPSDVALAEKTLAAF